MSPRKLTETDKREILQRYRNSGETTSILADVYGVSSSTISRFLKANLAEIEYEELIQTKRLARTGKGLENLENTTKTKETNPKKPKTETKTKTKTKETKTKEKAQEFEVIAQEAPKTTKRRQRSEAIVQTDLFSLTPEISPSVNKTILPQQEDIFVGEEDMAETIRQMLGEDVADSEEDLDEDDEDDEEWGDELDLAPQWTGPNSLKLKVLPVSEAAFPNPCYLVIDRMAELITRSLREFGELGKIPEEEIQQRTLPIFDNHRIAKRFSNRSQRVIKVPDSSLLEKTCSHLKAKGITRLLIDGQIYAL